MFARRLPPVGEKLAPEQLGAIQREVKTSLDELWVWLQRDVEARLG